LTHLPGPPRLIISTVYGLNDQRNLTPASSWNRFHTEGGCSVSPDGPSGTSRSAHLRSHVPVHVRLRLHLEGSGGGRGCLDPLFHRGTPCVPLRVSHAIRTSILENGTSPTPYERQWVSIHDLIVITVPSRLTPWLRSSPLYANYSAMSGGKRVITLSQLRAEFVSSERKVSLQPPSNRIVQLPTVGHDLKTRLVPRPRGGEGCQGVCAQTCLQHYHSPRGVSSLVPAITGGMGARQRIRLSGRGVRRECGVVPAGGRGWHDRGHWPDSLHAPHTRRTAPTSPAAVFPLARAWG